MFIAEGTLIDGKYEVLGTIGAGGMGVVYEVYHRALQRVVAVKMLSASSGIDDEDRARFEREALILSRLSHPSIVQFYSYGLWSNNVPYIVIERVNGHSLQHLLAKNRPLPVPLALHIVRQVCDGLQHAHASGVFHRDLKPANILIVDGGEQRSQVKIIDFGLAKLVGGDNFQKLTRTGMALGSVMYASPEQCLGQCADARSDIYGLGCTLYEMLTGHPPYCADNATAVMFQQLNDPVGSTEHWRKVPENLRPILAKCLAKEKERRYSSAVALNDDLGKVLEGKPAELEGAPVSADAVYCSPSNPFVPSGIGSSRSNSRHLVLAALGIFLFCLIIGGMFLSDRGHKNGVPRRPESYSARDELYKLVHTQGVTDGAMAKRLLVLIDLYRRDRSYAIDHTELVPKAYNKALGCLLEKQDFALVRRYCKQALEDCHMADRGTLGLLRMYHDACAPAHCQPSLLPLLQDALKRYPNAPRSLRWQIQIALAQDFLQMGRFDETRKACNQATILAIDEGEKKWSTDILNQCNASQREPSGTEQIAGLAKQLKEQEKAKEYTARTTYALIQHYRVAKRSPVNLILEQVSNPANPAYDNLVLRYELGRYYLEQGNEAKCEKIWKDLLKLARIQPLSRPIKIHEEVDAVRVVAYYEYLIAFGLAQIALENGRYRECLAVTEQQPIGAAWPEDSTWNRARYVNSLALCRAHGYRHLGAVVTAESLYRKVICDLESAIAKYEKEPTNRAWLSEARCGLACCLYLQGKYQQSLLAVNQAVSEASVRRSSDRERLVCCQVIQLGCLKKLKHDQGPAQERQLLIGDMANLKPDLLRMSYIFDDVVPVSFLDAK